MPGTIAQESPPSSLLKSEAGSTPHRSSFLSFLSPPGSSDQIFASARPSSFGKAGADFVSLNVFPRSVERSTFMPKNALQLEASTLGVPRPRVSIRLEYTDTPEPNGPRSVNFARAFGASATKRPFLVPIVTITFSAMSASRYRGQNRHHVPLLELCIEAAQIAHMGGVDEHVQVAPDGAGFIAKIRVQRRVASFELRERCAHIRGGHGEL